MYTLRNLYWSGNHRSEKQMQQGDHLQLVHIYGAEPWDYSIVAGVDHLPCFIASISVISTHCKNQLMHTPSLITGLTF